VIQHLIFFLALSVPIVVIGAFYSEPEDAPAFHSMPRRYFVFVGACGLVAGVMLVLEWLFLTG